MGPIAVGLIGLAIYIVNAQPTSSVELLPDADGKTGSVIVKAESGQQSVSTAFGSASVNRRGSIHTTNEDAGQVQQRYAATLAARPLAPVSFMVFFEFGSAVDIAPVFQPTLDKLKATWSDPVPSLPLKIIRIVTDPVILVFLIAIAVLIFYAVKCRKECPECPTLGTKTETSL